MKKTMLIIIEILLLLSCFACNKNNDNHKEGNETKTTNENNTNETKTASNTTNNDTATDEKSKSNNEIDAFIKDTDFQSDISDEEKTWILNTIKMISSKDPEAIKNALSGLAKEALDKDPNAIDNTLKPLDNSGEIKKISKVEKSDSTESDGTKSYLYNIVCEAEKDNLHFTIIRDDTFKMLGLKLDLEQDLLKQKELNDKYSAFADKAFEIINLISNKKYDEYKALCTKADATEADVKNLYDVAVEGFDMSGGIVDNTYTLSEHNIKDLFENAKSDGLSIEVLAKLKAKNNFIIDFDMCFDEDMNLLSINYNRYK